MNRYFCSHALLPAGWADDVVIEVDGAGWISAVAPDSGPHGTTRLTGVTVPGMPNLHSHAHQRAMAGLAERSGPGSDSFWTWREQMYQFANRISPDDLEAIAAQLYLEMLKAGYTAVAEFQYLHHDPAGRPYADPAELSLRCLAAAEQTGIGMTCLPVLYASGAFGGAAPAAHQRRFSNNADSFLDIYQRLRAACNRPGRRAGIAPHSLRAVPPALLTDVIGSVQAGDATAPIHVHIAEQPKEVADCLDWSGARPVEWLLDRQPVDGHWCLVHATHMTAAETKALAASGAVAGLCPTTEANLGDGLFPAVHYLAAGGRFGIGSDSHISVSPVEELRWLEYGQRLLHHSRNALAGGPERSTGRTLFDRALAGGVQALGQRLGRLAPGYRGDWLVLDENSALLAGRRGDALLDSWLFAGNRPCISDVVVGGRQVISDGRHAAEDAIGKRYRAALCRLLA